MIKWFGFCRTYYVQQKTAKDQNYLISAKPVKKQKSGENFLSTPFAESILFCQGPNYLNSAKPVKKQKLLNNFHSTGFAESILLRQTPISCYSANPVECQQCLEYSIIPQVLQKEIIGGATIKANFSRFLQNLWNFS